MEEKELKNKIEEVKEKYETIEVVDQKTYENAANIVKELTKIKKNVKSYWKEPISNAYKVHKSLKAKENEMVKPLEKAINYCKSQMSDYILIQESEKKRLEEESQVEENEFGVAPIVKSDISEVNGISYTSKYVLDQIDLEKLPKNLNGVQLIIADESAIKSLIKASKGKIKIPGVKFHEEKVIRANSK